MIMTVLFLKDNKGLSRPTYHVDLQDMRKEGGATSRGVACRAEEWKEKDSQVFPATFLITLNTN